MEKEKVLTRQEQIEELQQEHDRRQARAVELQQEHDRLIISLKKMDEAKTKEIEETLDTLPDATPKKIVDKILQLPDAKRAQIIGNISKLKVAALNERRKASEAAGRKSELENKIHQENINCHVVEVFKKFEKWIEFYKVAESYFYNDLLNAISQGYNLDPFFHMRADDLGLSATIKVSIDSHFKAESFDKLNMYDAVSDIARLGDAYGERLLDKTREPAKFHPSDDPTYHGIQYSDKPAWRDPENY